MERIEKRIGSIVTAIIESENDLFLVDVLLKGNIGNQKLLVFIDSDGTFNIDHCSLISRKLGAILEEEDIIEGKYILEVSSPGLDHPITLKRQYKKNIGRQLQVSKIDGSIVQGKLIKVNKDQIVLEVKNGTTVESSMNFNEINQSKIEVSFK